MTSQPLISVVVPVYNVENYLRRCFESIVSQTYTNLEIILVDDGSTDGSGALCDELEKSDNRVLVIHRNNGGLSAARNSGLSIAKGDFVVFWDSDDWVEEELLEQAIKEQTKFNSDLVVWGYAADFVDSRESVVSSAITRFPTYGYEKGDKIPVSDTPGMLGALGYAWNKLYRKSLLINGNLCFEEGTSLVEDVLYNANVFQHIKRISFIDYVGTHYIQRRRETLGVKYYPNFLELKLRATEAQARIQQSCGTDELDISAFLHQSNLHIFWNTVKNIAKSNLPEIEKREEVKKLYLHADIIDNVRHYRTLSIKDKIKKTLILFASPRLLIHITNLI